MSNLFVVAFQDEASAGMFLREVGDLQKEGLIQLDDAATVVRDKNGKAKVRQANSLVGTGALGGAFWGMLIGLIFFVPVLGMATGAALGALAAKGSDYGIDDDFIKDLGEKLQPGSSAIFLLVRQAEPEKVIGRLQRFKGEVIHTSLSPDQEAQLKEAFSPV